MPQWLTKVLTRLHALARRGVRLTLKAQAELASLELGLDVDDAGDILIHLRTQDFVQRLSVSKTNETLYVFKPRVGAVTLYLKVVLRSECVIISIHEDETDAN